MEEHPTCLANRRPKTEANRLHWLHGSGQAAVIVRLPSSGEEDTGAYQHVSGVLTWPRY